jgi:hypothetical protein
VVLAAADREAITQAVLMVLREPLTAAVVVVVEKIWALAEQADQEL